MCKTDMETTRESVLSAALALPEQDRIAIADKLWESIHGPVPADIEAAWSDEIARRLEEIDHGKVQMIPWPKVRDALRRLTGG